MAGEIQIQGDLKFIGYRQLSLAGSNGQFLRFNNGVASWGNTPTNNPDEILTTNIEKVVLVDRAGNIIVSRNETYVGIDTKGRVPIVSGGSEIVAGETLNILIGSWVAPTIPDGTLRQTIAHTLNTENLIAQFFEQLTSPGRFLDVFVPWRVINNSNIEACIPTGSAFAGKVKLI